MPVSIKKTRRSGGVSMVRKSQNKRPRVCRDTDSDQQQNKRLKVCHDTDSDDDQQSESVDNYISEIIESVKKEEKNYVLLAVIDSQKLNTALLSNKDRCTLGRLCFTQNKFMMRNIDSSCVLHIHSRINRNAFNYYFCRCKKVIVECCLETLCKNVDGKQRDGVITVISVPNSTEETGYYGPIDFRYINTAGLRETTRVTIPKVILDMPYIGKRHINYVFDFCMSCAHLKRTLNMLKTDSTADSLKITTSAERLVFSNENGDSTVPISITVLIDYLDEYSFNRELAEGDSFSILVPRPKILGMLALKGIDKCIARLRGMEQVMSLSYLYDNNEGFVEFLIANKFMPDDHYA